MSYIDERSPEPNPKNLERGDFVVYKSTETSNLLHLAVVRGVFPEGSVLVVTDVERGLTGPTVVGEPTYILGTQIVSGPVEGLVMFDGAQLT